MIRITWNDTRSEYVISPSQVCWASRNASLDTVTVYFTNGKSLEFEGSAGRDLYAVICSGIGSATIQGGSVEGAG